VVALVATAFRREHGPLVVEVLAVIVNLLVNMLLQEKRTQLQ
jgi:hypothetical protein